jgi:putative SOS response-associated peptidase YedK
MKPRYNIAPQTENPVIVKGKLSGEGARQHMEVMQWGLVPHWAKDPKIGYKMINARAESVHEKPSFRDPFKKQRCLVPANGFYEWPVDPKNPKRKTPLYIHLKSDDLFAFAGIWSLWGEGETLKRTYSLITTEPNPMLAKYHDRMPVILSRDEEEIWLNPDTKAADLQKLLDPYPAKEMEAYEVSTLVNKPVNDSPENIKPVKAA